MSLQKIRTLEPPDSVAWMPEATPRPITRRSRRFSTTVLVAAVAASFWAGYLTGNRDDAEPELELAAARPAAVDPPPTQVVTTVSPNDALESTSPAPEPTLGERIPGFSGTIVTVGPSGVGRWKADGVDPEVEAVAAPFSSPEWDPNAHHYAFLSGASSERQMLTIGDMSSEQTPVDVNVHSFAWHPTESRVAYVARGVVDSGERFVKVATIAERIIVEKVFPIAAETGDVVAWGDWGFAFESFGDPSGPFIPTVTITDPGGSVRFAGENAALIYEPSLADVLVIRGPDGSFQVMSSSSDAPVDLSEYLGFEVENVRNTLIIDPRNLGAITSDPLRYVTAEGTRTYSVDIWPTGLSRDGQFVVGHLGSRAAVLELATGQWVSLPSDDDVWAVGVR